MTQNISDEETIADAVRSVMLHKQRIESQSELAERVLEELRILDPEVRVSAKRIRRIAVTSGAARVVIEYRDSSKKDLPEICPVCNSGMSQVLNNTLDGGITEIKRNCTVCSFSVGKKILTPGRYVFIRNPTKEIATEEMRLRKLKKAASLLRGASKLIGEALEGTNFPQRKEYSQDLIHQILTSREMTGSIPNLEADIRGEGHSDPLWTKAFSSPKYPNRKDI